jgi:hypothetical protein
VINPAWRTVVCSEMTKNFEFQKHELEHHALSGGSMLSIAFRVRHRRPKTPLFDWA